MTDIILMLTTVPIDESGERIAAALVEEHLAACVTLGPAMTSVYWWQGALTRDTERQLVIKTTRDRAGALGDRLRALHPYELPELIVVPVVDGSEAYLNWVRAATVTGPPAP